MIKDKAPVKQVVMRLPAPLLQKMSNEVDSEGYGKLSNLIIQVFTNRYRKEGK